MTREDPSIPAPPAPPAASASTDEAIQAFRHEVDMPSFAPLMRNIKTLLFIAFSAAQKIPVETDMYRLLDRFTRLHQDHWQCALELRDRFCRIAAHLRAIHTVLARCEEDRVIECLRACSIEAGDIARAVHRLSYQCNCMGDAALLLSCDIRNSLEKQEGCHSDVHLKKAVASIDLFMESHRALWVMQGRAGYTHGDARERSACFSRMAEKLREAERRRDYLAFMPLLLGSLQFTTAPAAAVLPGEWFTAEEVRRHFERLELGGECRIQGLRAIAALGAAVKRAAFAKAPLPAAMIALFAVAYSFLPITNALRDLARFCQDIEGYHWGPTNVRISVFSDMLARLRACGTAERAACHSGPFVRHSVSLAATNMEAFAKMCAHYAESLEHIPYLDFVKTILAMDEEKRSVRGLAADLEKALKEPVSMAEKHRQELLRRKARVLETHAPVLCEAM